MNKQNKNALEINKEYSNNYVQKVIISKPEFIKDYLDDVSIEKIVDLGCGDGNFLKSVSKFFPNKKLYGTDISDRRISGLKTQNPSFELNCGDICSTPYESSFFDFVNCEVVIEHVEDDKSLVSEIARILKPGKFLHISSVIKKRWAVYFYRNMYGKIALDPTHEREYRDKEEFLSLFENDFILKKVEIFHIRRLKLPVPGYFRIRAIFQKK